jgi:alpha-amylase/alpha-mannosidase (GH57 family)
MGYICIHGHFYQPPRENPWLEAVELQESAHPYHDWNARIDAECYARNAASRILDEEKRIVRIVNNYAKISFNFGPTLLSWIQINDPAVYGAILEADAESAKAFSGHGSALAQPYSHMIMPLANERDKNTQAFWGVRDFEHRFGRKPEGMWLPETAVDLPTLEVLAQLGMKFTILAPNQANRLRKVGGRTWKDVSKGQIDPTMVYRLRLPSGRSINLFFYDGPISRAIAFEGLLANGEQFAQRLLGAFSEETRPWPELVHIATDGETYGHHHPHGEMALTYALDHIESNELAELINYGLYLERHPATHLVEIFENSSWSCVHGVERWRSNCGCNSGGHPGWNQEWRAPLREALDWLRDTLASLFEEKAGTLIKDPWAARNDYIDVVLDRSAAGRDRFLARHAVRELDEAEKITVWKLMELQRHAMLMYTSCGWFFDELSGIETVQVIQYAGRAAQLAEELFGDQRESLFLERLSQAKSNIPEHQDGGRIYQKFVKPAFIDLRKVGTHYAIRSLFEPYETNTHVYAYAVERQAGSNLAKDGTRERRLAVGRARFTSDVTQESAALALAAFDRGDLNPVGGILKLDGDEGYAGLNRALTKAFSEENLDEVGRLLHENFEGEPYSLTVLFRDEQRRILNRIIEAEWAEAETAFDNLFPHLMSITRTLAKVGTSLPVPRAFQAAAEFALNTQLRRTFASDNLDFDSIRNLMSDAEAAKVSLDVPTLEYALRIKLERMAERFRGDQSNLEALARLDAAVALARSLPFEVNLWKLQNTAYELLQTAYQDFQQKAAQGDENAKAWISRFQGLADKLSLRVEPASS